MVMAVAPPAARKLGPDICTWEEMRQIPLTVERLERTAEEFAPLVGQDVVGDMVAVPPSGVHRGVDDGVVPAAGRRPPWLRVRST